MYRKGFAYPHAKHFLGKVLCTPKQNLLYIHVLYTCCCTRKGRFCVPPRKLKLRLSLYMYIGTTLRTPTQNHMGIGFKIVLNCTHPLPVSLLHCPIVSLPHCLPPPLSPSLSPSCAGSLLSCVTWCPFRPWRSPALSSSPLSQKNSTSTVLKGGRGKHIGWNL